MSNCTVHRRATFRLQNITWSLWSLDITMSNGSKKASRVYQSAAADAPILCTRRNVHASIATYAIQRYLSIVATRNTNTRGERQKKRMILHPRPVSHSLTVQFPSSSSYSSLSPVKEAHTQRRRKRPSSSVQRIAILWPRPRTLEPQQDEPIQ